MLELVRRFGSGATSFQVLEPGYRYFFPDREACVAYIDTGRAWVAAGAPLAAEARFAGVAAAFIDAARTANRRACFFATEDRFVRRVPMRSLLMGEQPIWEPASWNRALRDTPSLREQLRRARAKGVHVRAVDGRAGAESGAPTRDAMVGVISRWLRMRELAPLGFLARVEPLALLPDRRLFVAERAGLPVGILSVAPIYDRQGWLLQNLLRAPEAPNGTAELLFDHAMREALACGRQMVTLGLAPLAGGVRAPLRFARRAGSDLFNFEGLYAFKAKLRPSRWDAVHLSFPDGTSGVRAVVDVLAAFARGDLLRFGLATLARGPALIVRLLGLLLVPWTILLASADVARWFPGPAVKWGWVAFDVTVACGLFALHRRWRTWLARLLVAATAADAVTTVIEGMSLECPPRRRRRGIRAAGSRDARAGICHIRPRGGAPSAASRADRLSMNHPRGAGGDKISCRLPGRSPRPCAASDGLRFALTWHMRFRAFAPSLLLFAIGCGHTQLMPAPSASRVPGAVGAAFLVVDGIGCAADAQAWQGRASEMPDSVTPMKVRVVNSSGRPIRLLYQDFALVGAHGRRYLPVPVLPLTPDDQSTRIEPTYASSKFFVAPRFHDVYQGVDSWPEPLGRDEDVYETQYRRWGRDRPSLDIVEMGMPEGVLGDGGIISGFLYFERPAHEDGVTFEAEFDSSEGQATVASVKIPFRVK